MSQNNERKSFAAFAVTAALLLSSLPALAAPLAASVPIAGTLANLGNALAATPAVTVTPATVPANLPSQIVVSGSGFTPTTTLNQGYVVQCTPPYCTFPPLGQIVLADPNGNFTVPATVTAPSGPITITVFPIANGMIGNAPVVSTTLQVSTAPTVTVTPSSGVPQQQVVANGANLGAAGTPVTVTFTPPGTAIAVPVGNGTLGELGNVTVPFPVPFGSNPGTATVSIVSGTTTLVSTPFQVLAPSIGATPSSGPPSSSTSVTGTGFTANSPVTVTLLNPSSTVVATNTVPVVSGPTGSFPGAFLTVPANAAAGTYTIRAVDTSGRTATTPFVVTPITTTTTGNLTLVPVSGQACAGGAQANVVPSEPVNAFVSGFGPTETVSIIIGGQTVTTTTSSANGVATAVFNTPTATPNMTYTVSAVGGTTGRVATSNLYQCNVSQAATPSSIVPGQGVTLSGAGFGAGEVVSETIYNASATTPVTFGVGAPGVTQAFTATANATGAFSQLYTPTLSFGTYTARSQGLSTGLFSTTTFAVGPGTTSITSTPSPVFPCATFTLSATSGFSPTEVVSVTPQGGSTVTATVGSTGGFVATATAPANAPLSGLPVTINSARGVFTFTQPITVPTAVITASPSTVPSFGSSTTLVGSGFIPNSAVNLATYFAGTNGLISAGGPTTVVTAGVAGTFTTTYAVSPTVQVINGQYTISATSQCSPANTAQTGVTVTTGVGPSGPPQQPTTLYFAEGYTGRLATNQKADFDEFISVLNPDNFAKVVTFTYQLQPNNVAPITTTTVFTQVVPANSDILRNVNGDVGNDQIVSAIVSSDFRIAAERVQNRTTASGRLDNDSSLGNTAPGTTWYFAEGYTGASFQEYLTVQNPTSSTATYTVTFLPAGTPAVPARQLSFTVAAHGRDTQNIRRLYNNAFVDPGVVARGGGESVGMLLNSTAPIVAERVMYWGDGVGSAKYGASSKAGLTNPATQFLFAFGSATGTATGVGPAQQTGDESFITVINSNPAGTTDANVQAVFRDSSGKVIGSKFITVSPQTRETIVVNNVISTTAGPHWVTVSSDLPVFVEKPNYVGGSPNMGMHPGMSPSGSPAGLQFVLFPNVNTASASGQPISETVFLVNTGAQAETVVGTYYTPNGQTTQVPYVLAPNQQRVINVNLDAGNLPAGPLGAQYTTSGFGQFIAARIANSPDQKAYIGNQGVFNNQ